MKDLECLNMFCIKLFVYALSLFFSVFNSNADEPRCILDAGKLLCENPEGPDDKMIINSRPWKDGQPWEDKSIIEPPVGYDKIFPCQDSCGDGFCSNTGCFGCPCEEDFHNCPEDCFSHPKSYAK